MIYPSYPKRIANEYIVIACNVNSFVNFMILELNSFQNYV